MCQNIQDIHCIFAGELSENSDAENCRETPSQLDSFMDQIRQYRMDKGLCIRKKSEAVSMMQTLQARKVFTLPVWVKVFSLVTEFS